MIEKAIMFMVITKQLIFYTYCSQVLGLTGKVKEAISLLKKALDLEPESRLIHQELARMREKARIEAESEKSLYRRMLGLKQEITQSERPYPVIKTVSGK